MKKKSRQSKRQFESYQPVGVERGETLLKVWVRVCYWSLQTLTLFQTKTVHFTALFKTRMYSKHSLHVQSFWSRKTPNSLPRSIFLSCHAILLPNDGSCVICAPWYSVTTNIPANGADWYSTEGCTYYTRSQLDTRRHKTKNCIPCLWLKTLNTILCSVANTILGQIRESPRVLSKTKEWSD